MTHSSVEIYPCRNSQKTKKTKKNIKTKKQKQKKTKIWGLVSWKFVFFGFVFLLSFVLFWFFWFACLRYAAESSFADEGRGLIISGFQKNISLLKVLSVCQRKLTQPRLRETQKSKENRCENKSLLMMLILPI